MFNQSPNFLFIWNIFSKEIIVDMLSVERNNILVRTYLIGGPSERILPKRQIKLVSFSQPSLVDPSNLKMLTLKAPRKKNI